MIMTKVHLFVVVALKVAASTPIKVIWGQLWLLFLFYILYNIETKISKLILLYISTLETKVYVCNKYSAGRVIFALNFRQFSILYNKEYVYFTLIREN